MFERGDVVGEPDADVLPVPVQAGQPPASTHSLNGSVMTGAESWTPAEARPDASGVVRGVIRSTTLEDIRDGGSDPLDQGRVHEISELGHHPRNGLGVARQVVARDQGDRSSVGKPSGGEARDEPRRGRGDRRAQIGSQRDDIGENSSVPPIQAAVARPPIAGLGDRGREERDSWGCDDVEPGVVLGGGMDVDEAADHRM